METDAVLLCYKGGMLGWALVRTAVGLPALLWAGVSYSSTTERTLDWTLLAAGWPLVVALQYMAASFWLDRHAHTALPGLKCNNDIRAMPDLSMWLLAHYVVVMCVHELVAARWPGLWGHLRRLLYLVAVPAVLVWSGNTTVPYALAGAGFGAATGLICAALLVAVWLPRLDAAVALVRAPPPPDAAAAHTPRY